MLPKSVSVLAVLSAIVLSPLAANAVVTTPKNSANFNYKYEMTVLPTADDQGGVAGADWTTGTDGQTGGPPSVSGGNMTVDFAGNPYFEFNNGDTGLVDFTTGYTIEMRARVVNSPTPFSMGIIALPGLGHNDQIPFLQFGSSQMTWGETGSINTQSNTDAFHVFRLAQEPNTGTYSVWRDGVLVNGALTTARGDLAGLGLRKIAFGDEGGAWSGSTQVDYFRFDTTGAYAPVPVPEPATWGLAAMGLGAMLLLRKRRRRV